MHSEEEIKRIVSLIGKQIRGELNANDERDLQVWMSEGETNKIMFDQLTDSTYRQSELMEMRSFTSAPAAFANFMEKYGERVPVADEVYVPSKPEFKRKWNYEFLKYGGTAVVLLALSTGFFVYLNNEDRIVSRLDNNGIKAAKDVSVEIFIGSDIHVVQDHTIILKPSLQSFLDDKITDIYDKNLKNTIFWKQGFFTFNKESLKSLMQKIARWYDIDVIYVDDNVDKTLYTGSASRFSNIASLLNKLERSGPAKFKIEGRRVMVRYQQ